MGLKIRRAPEIHRSGGAHARAAALGGVFGVAVVVAVFAGAGSYASPQTFTAGFGPAIGVGAVLALAGAVSALALPATKPLTLATEAGQ